MLTNRIMFKYFFVLMVVSVLAMGCSSGKRRTTGDEPFFLNEKDLTGHGKKGIIDRIYQIDPGDKNFTVADKFYTSPPRKIAILPFENLVGGNYILNEIPIPRFNDKKKDSWNWTYANRLRRFFFGHFAAREFQDLELMYIDKFLQEIGVKSPNDLNKISPKELGRILDVDALIYGKVTDYKNSYYTLFAQIRIGLHIKCVATDDESVLFEGEHKRYDNDIRLATNPIDFIFASFQNYMSLRDVYAARASEEVARELVLRIPIVDKFIEEEEQRIKERIKSGLASLHGPVIEEQTKNGPNSAPSLQDKQPSPDPQHIKERTKSEPTSLPGPTVEEQTKEGPDPAASLLDKQPSPGPQLIKSSHGHITIITKKQTSEQETDD